MRRRRPKCNEYDFCSLSTGCLVQGPRNPYTALLRIVLRSKLGPVMGLLDLENGPSGQVGRDQEG